jgi:hypothetical protein
MMLVSPITTDEDIDELVNQWDRYLAENWREVKND